MQSSRIPFGPIVAGAGAMLCIAALASLEQFTHEGLWLMAPFGATMVLVFGLPDSPLAQPRNIVFGHLLTTAVGLTAAHYLGITPWSLGAAVGLALFLMLMTKTTHPPAGANPVLVMLTGQGWGFLLTPVLAGTLMIVAIALVYNRWLCHRDYPVKWL